MNYENAVVGIYDDSLFKTLEEKIGEKNLFELWKEEILTNERFIYAEEFGYLLLKSKNVDSLINILGIERTELKIESLSEIVECYQCSQDFGIKEYDILNFHYDEVYEQLIMYFDDSNNSDEIWNDIKLNGLDKFLEKKYKEQTRVMIKNRLKELQDFAESGEIEIW